MSRLCYRILPSLLLCSTLLTSTIGCGASDAAKKTKKDQPSESTMESAPESVTISAAGGQLEAFDGSLGVYIPEGAVPESVELTVREVADTDAPFGRAYELGPHGLHFNELVLIALSYADWDLGDVSPEELVVATEVDGEWIAASPGPRDPDLRLVSGLTHHFSMWTLVPIADAQGWRPDGEIDLEAYESCCESGPTWQPSALLWGELLWEPDNPSYVPGIGCANIADNFALPSCYAERTGTELYPCNQCERDCCSIRGPHNGDPFLAGHRTWLEVHGGQCGCQPWSYPGLSSEEWRSWQDEYARCVAGCKAPDGVTEELCDTAEGGDEECDDEINDENGCNEYEFQCANGACIDESLFCDDANTPDCSDGSDEPVGCDGCDKNRDGKSDCDTSQCLQFGADDSGYRQSCFPDPAFTQCAGEADGLTGPELYGIQISGTSGIAVCEPGQQCVHVQETCYNDTLERNYTNLALVCASSGDSDSYLESFLLNRCDAVTIIRNP